MDYWSLTEGVFNCLIDKKRTQAFEKAINNTVKKGDVVVDMGTGSGVLSLMAAKAGASRVYTVEFDANNIKTLEKVFERNGYSKVIKLIEGDVTSISLPEKVDVIIGEMIATGLIEELQIPAMNNMHKYAKEGVKVLLNKYENYIDLVFNNQKYYGYTFDVVRYEYDAEKELRSIALSDKRLLSVADFTVPIKNTKVNFSQKIEVAKNGELNGVRISSKTIFSDLSTFDYSFAYSYPIILPIQPRMVKKGDIISVDLFYEMCKGFQNLRYNVT